ncbi:RNA polymerase sigma factor [Serratia phage Muldoon]|uniref:RNA polymerase sigma-like factor n=1 Tax=Serratia phage Muldoon TaxID=2601678 RepID=A0A5P8PH54_9CAUD|nr:late sigma transcription factor [Serratia phage Muldoon]QFR56016.1 RNA polymerase sigma factor [Serratia phage Muldoon]
MTEKKNNYVNNPGLYKRICAWKQECYANPDKRIPIPDSIGLDIIRISKALVKRWNFSGYTQTWKQEMVDDGIMAAIAGLHNFDEVKYNNPHTYITTACFNAFVQRIKKERHELAVKQSYFINNVYDSNHVDDEMHKIADETFIQDIHNKLNDYEQSRKSSGSKKKKDDDTGPTQATLESFYEDET